MISNQTRADKDDIDVVATLRILWRGKWAIFLITALFAAGSVYWALTATPVFSAMATVTQVGDQGASPASSLASQFGGLAGLAGVNLRQGGASLEYQAVLRSRSLVEEFIRRNELIDELSPPDGPPLSLWFAVKQFREKVLRIMDEDDAGVTRIVVSWTDPQVAAQWANGLVALANELISSEALAESERNIAYLNDQIKSTSIVGLQRVMYNLIESETKKVMLANARRDYAFAVVDAAVAPEMRSKPKRKIIVLTGVAVGFGFAVFCVLGWHLFRRVTAETAGDNPAAASARQA